MLGGTVSDFDAAQPSMQTVLAREADTPIDAVYLALTAGSVIVEAELYFGTAAGATFAASQLLAGIFASSAALETALNIQFEEDLVGVTASVQQILVAPEYDAAEASLVGIGVGVGVGAVLLVVVVGGVVLHRMRRKTPTAAQALPAAQAMQSVPLPQQVKKGRPVSVREEGTAAAAILVDTTGDGVADSVHVDTSGDGRPDTIVPLGESARSRNASEIEIEVLELRKSLAETKRQRSLTRQALEDVLRAGGGESNTSVAGEPVPPAPVPPQYLCPITGEIMEDPVTTADGHAYERAAIAQWLLTHHTSPVTDAQLPHRKLAPAHALRQLIEEFVATHPAM